MKECPNCNSTYQNSMAYCLQDGTLLVESQTTELPETVLIKRNDRKENHFLKIKVVRRKKEFEECTVFYPQIINHPQKHIESRINGFLRRQFFEGYTEPENTNWEDSEAIYNSIQNEDATEETEEDFPTIETAQGVHFKTKLISDETLSIKYEWWATGGAHPIYGHKGFTLELSSGYLYSFEDLFKEKSHYLPIINELISKSLKRDGNDYEFTKKNEYEFILTKKHLVIFNIFNFEAARGVEASIRISEIEYIIRPNSPLQSLLR